MQLTAGDAQTMATEVLTAFGLGAHQAQVTARALVLAELWGVGSHGLLRMPHYLRRLDLGGYTTHEQLAVRSDNGPVVVYDGEGGLGHWQVWQAAETAVDRVREHGVSVVAVGNSGHCGALGVFTLPALQAGQACLVFSNGPAVMPAWGGNTPLLSTSPFAVGIPDADGGAIIDMATSTVARGKIAAHASTNTPLPPGWALDRDGAPTTDPAAALHGMLAPMGGAKGFALALVVELLTGGLVGPSLSRDVADMFVPAQDREPQRIAHLVIGLDTKGLDVFGDVAAAPARIGQLFDSVRTTGGRVPGERKRPLSPQDDSTLITVNDSLADELSTLAAPRGIDLAAWLRP